MHNGRMLVDMMGRALEMMAVQKGPRLPIGYLENVGKNGCPIKESKRHELFASTVSRGCSGF